MQSPREPTKLDAWEREMVRQYGTGCKCGHHFTIYDDKECSYMVGKCDQCGAETCIDTNIVIILHDIRRMGH